MYTTRLPDTGLPDEAFNVHNRAAQGLYYTCNRSTGRPRPLYAIGQQVSPRPLVYTTGQPKASITHATGQQGARGLCMQ